MARTAARLPDGARITDYISLGVVAKTFGSEKIKRILVENGTHVLFGSRMDGYQTGEITLAKETLLNLKRGMLCLADRSFFGFELWRQAQATGTELLWRVKKNVRLVPDARLADGSQKHTRLKRTVATQETVS